MSAVTAAAVAAGSIAAAMYLDAKLLIRHDMAAGSLTANANAAVKYIMEKVEKDRMLMYHLLEDNATGKHANNLFVWFEGHTWTYRQFFADLQRVGNWLMKDLGVERGEVVAIDGGNSPEYLMLWFALDGIGACPAFINCNLTAQPLRHCVELADARYLIADRATEPLVRPIEKELASVDITTVYYDSDFIRRLSDATPLPQSRRSKIMPDELRSLIYTSGTTGMPKGTIMLTGRELNTARSIGNLLNLKPGDRMYTALPLYHGAAHGLCVTPSIYSASAVILGRKFSHKTFWPEARVSNANILQYVGELCRYLINAPPSPQDKNHSIRMAWGNGMRPDVWEVFRQRFNIETVNELYAATDGLGASFNANRGEFGRGAIGVRGWYWNLNNGSNEKRVRLDIETQDIIRDPRTGFVIECKIGEPGEVLHRMDPATEKVAFAGYYKNPSAGEKRKMRSVFEKGDLWFRSGDMMRQDADGTVYFVDRLGDTFRWKSENVSTNEVSDVLGEFPQIAETNVYGVLVPNADGRAGCAAIVMVDGTNEETFNFQGLAQHAIGTLPRYAVPIFLRVVKELSYTGTMKVQKGKLRSEGVDLEAIQQGKETGEGGGGKEDKMYWLPPGASCYVPFGRKEWDELRGGKVRL